MESGKLVSTIPKLYQMRAEINRWWIRSTIAGERVRVYLQQINARMALWLSIYLHVFSFFEYMSFLLFANKEKDMYK